MKLRIKYCRMQLSTNCTICQAFNDAKFDNFFFIGVEPRFYQSCVLIYSLKKDDVICGAKLILPLKSAV